MEEFQMGAGKGTTDLWVDCLSSLKVLLVEDDKINQTVIVGMLKPLKFDIDAVETGQAAIDYVQNYPCDLILTDVGLSDMTGIDVTEKIRAASGPVSMCPIIGVTAHASKADRARCIDVGMNECLTKPVDQQALILAVKNCYEQIKARQQSN